jgi:hypothetical protein
MHPNDVLSWNRAVPFAPYRIRLNSGRTFEIRHPEMVHVGRTAMTIFSFAGDITDPYERIEMVSLVMIERLEPSNAPAVA